ncbi:MAG: alkaline phosphatase, partial [Alphaproteobacteria bacterium]|nr:alkaline phosphatase [Alphaproteobacteria bacterium]
MAGLVPIRMVAATPAFINDPFQLGVASGDPNTDGFVIWTRLAPDPYDPKALPDEAIEVRWEVSEDVKFRKIVSRGTVFARPELAHSVHVDLRGLASHREYFYRFICGGAESPVGRGMTWPAPTASAEKLRFAFASCQHYEQGYFSAYRDMVAQDPGLIVHLGDYIYDVSYGRTVRHHPIADARTLDDYRQIHAVYKLDPDLAAAHRHCPWLLVWDDHEVDNDYSAIDSEDDSDPAIYLARRRAAYQAYYEHMPLRASAAPTATGNMYMFQRINYGDLAEFNQLDLRQYRAPIVCKTPTFKAGRVIDVTQCPDLNDPARTMLGTQQEFW